MLANTFAVAMTAVNNTDAARHTVMAVSEAARQAAADRLYFAFIGLGFALLILLIVTVIYGPPA